MRTEKIYFSNQQALCVFPTARLELSQAALELKLNYSYPVIVLIGGEIDKKQAIITQRAIQTIAMIAKDIHAAVICGGTNMGVMAEMGKLRWENHYKFPLIGIAPEELVTWPGGSPSTKFLWWGKQRWQLAPNYSHFMLVPGNQFGDESAWIVDTATLLSKEHKAVTILINGGEVSRKDVELSLEQNRPVITMRRTGRLADELANQFERNPLITTVSGDAQQRIVESVQMALSVSKNKVLSESTISMA